MQALVTYDQKDGIDAYVRNYSDALILIGNALSKYVSSITKSTVSIPEIGLIDTLLSQSNLLVINTIETEIFSTFIDIGISTSLSFKPASIVTIYDIYSDTWHCD